MTAKGLSRVEVGVLMQARSLVASIHVAPCACGASAAVAKRYGCPSGCECPAGRACGCECPAGRAWRALYELTHEEKL